MVDNISHRSNRLGLQCTTKTFYSQDGPEQPLMMTLGPPSVRTEESSGNVNFLAWIIIIE